MNSKQKHVTGNRRPQQRGAGRDPLRWGGAPDRWKDDGQVPAPFKMQAGSSPWWGPGEGSSAGHTPGPLGPDAQGAGAISGAPLEAEGHQVYLVTPQSEPRVAPGSPLGPALALAVPSGQPRHSPRSGGHSPRGREVPGWACLGSPTPGPACRDLRDLRHAPPSHRPSRQPLCTKPSGIQSGFRKPRHSAWFGLKTL